MRAYAFRFGGSVLAIYICSKCLFCFERTSLTEICPDCGSMCVRETDNEETAEYKRIRAELSNEKKEKP